MNKRTVASIIKKIEKLKIRIGKDRDEIRELLDTAEGLHEVCVDAHEQLEYAAERLSELV